MAIEVFNRFEHKYMLDETSFHSLVPYIEKYMELDPYNADHQCYTIANLYYDTADDYLIRRSLAKPAYKEKIRLRSYGVPDKNGLVYLELKKKYRGLVNKRRTPLFLEEARRFLTTFEKPEQKEYMNGQVLNELAYSLNHYRPRPKVYIAYDRLAYFEKENDDLRISFDCNIRTRRTDLHLEAGDYGSALLDEGIWLMEIKTSLAKPLWLTHMLTELQLRRISFSKYGTEYVHMTAAQDKQTQAEPPEFGQVI